MWYYHKFEHEWQIEMNPKVLNQKNTIEIEKRVEKTGRKKWIKLDSELWYQIEFPRTFLVSNAKDNS